MLEVTWLDADAFAEPDAYRRAYTQVPQERRARIDSCRFVQDRRLSLGAGLLLWEGLRKYGAEDVPLCRGKHGKPYLDGREDLHFNLSHSGHIAALALSDRPVGIDVEQCRVFSDALLRRVFLPEELAAAPAENPDRYYTGLWTVKESVMKYFGAGLTLAPRKIRVFSGSALRVSAEGFLCEGLRFTTLPLADCMLTVCAEYALDPACITHHLPGR